jgi:predicted flap endonuclease-1-like 5' DNA nuclease
MFVLIQNIRNGSEKRVSARTWDLMRNSVEQGDVRKGFRLVSRTAPKPPGVVVKGDQPTFVPPEITEAENKAHAAKAVQDAALVSGLKVEAETAPAAVVEASLVAEAIVEAESAPAPPTAPGQDLTKVEGIGPKVAELLNAIGITTYKELAAASINAINEALDKASLSPKKAQVPGWKMKAKALAA